MKTVFCSPGLGLIQTIACFEAKAGISSGFVLRTFLFCFVWN